MAELLDILDAFTTPLKIAWVIWIAWGIGQVFWYRYERKPHASKPAAAFVRKPFISRPAGADRGGTRLVTPEQVASKAPSFETPLAESASSGTEGPGQVAELDRFVADFEMNTRQRQGLPHNGEPVSFDTHPQHTT